MLITSLNNNHIKEIIKLKDKKYRDLTNTYLVEGKHLIEEAYQQGLLEELIKEESDSFSLDVKTTEVTKEIMQKINSTSSLCRIMAIVRKSKAKEIGNRVLILDNIQDPGNLGTIIRSAVAFNIDTLILSNDTVDLYNEKVIRATQGMLFHLNIIRTELISKITSLKEEGYQIIGTNVHNGIDINELVINHKFALIMGNEGQGVKEEIIKMCDQSIYIKMNSSCESLNVGVACSIILHAIDNQ